MTRTTSAIPTRQCKAINCREEVPAASMMDYCAECFGDIMGAGTTAERMELEAEMDRQLQTTDLSAREQHLLQSYPAYYKDVRHLNIIDVYRVLDLFDVTDHPAGHAAKKLLLCGVRTGGKPTRKELTEARDTIDRQLHMLEEDALARPLPALAPIQDLSKECAD